MSRHMVDFWGLEPQTHWLRVSCSTNWAKSPYYIFSRSFVKVGLGKPLRYAINCLPRLLKTCHRQLFHTQSALIKSQLRLPTELKVHIMFFSAVFVKVGLGKPLRYAINCLPRLLKFQKIKRGCCKGGYATYFRFCFWSERRDSNSQRLRN